MAEQNFCLVFFKMDSKVSDAPIRHAAAKTKTQKQVIISLEIFSLLIEIYFYNKSHLNRLNMSSYIMICKKKHVVRNSKYFIRLDSMSKK